MQVEPPLTREVLYSMIYCEVNKEPALEFEIEDIANSSPMSSSSIEYTPEVCCMLFVELNCLQEVNLQYLKNEEQFESEGEEEIHKSLQVCYSCLRY